MKRIQMECGINFRIRDFMHIQGFKSDQATQPILRITYFHP